MSNIDTESKENAIKIINDFRAVLHSLYLHDEDMAYVCDEVQKIIDYERIIIGLV